MKTLYLECSMGAAGDMLMSALYELLEDQESYLSVLNTLELPDVSYHAERVSSQGIAGSRIRVKINGKEEGEEDCNASHEHCVHHSLKDILELIDGQTALPERVRADAKAVFLCLAQAEAAVHGCEPGAIHFHELGSMDAAADVIGVCYAVYLLAPERVVVSPIHVGAGTVKCAHGIVPVPAPATAELLKQAPVYSGGIEGELCTPTGAALLTYLANSFGDLPGMRTEKIGYGIGANSFSRPNCLRAFWGSTSQEGRGSILEIVANIDDMTPEALAFASSRLMELGALDVYTVAGCFKKGRCGHILTVLCSAKREQKMVKYILKHTTSNGVRVRECRKYFLQPSFQQIDTEYGTVQYKKSDAFGITHVKAEYEDLARIAREKDLPFQAVFECAARYYNQL